jgi:hypothetical protein
MKPAKMLPKPARFVALVREQSPGVYVASDAYMEYIVEHAPTMQDAGELQFRTSTEAA